MLYRSLLLFVGLVATGTLSTSVSASIIQFDLRGTGGTGLLGGNENGAVVGGGSGGETNLGITFDDVTNILTVNVGWGSATLAGFADLTGNATVGHIHGPTLSGGVAAFTQNAVVKYGLDGLAGWNPSASSGGVSGDVAILAADVAGLLDGRFYVNIHTATNGGGEIRGNLTAVPEPTSLAMFGFASSIALLVIVRSRRKKIATES